MRAGTSVLGCGFTKKSAHNRGRSLRFAVSAISQDAAAVPYALVLAGLVRWRDVPSNQPRLPVLPCRYRDCSAR